MKLTNKEVIAECKREAKKFGFTFLDSGEMRDDSAVYQYNFKSGELYRKCFLGLAFEIACSDELKLNAKQPIPRGFQKQFEGGKRKNIYLDDESEKTAKALGNGNVSEGIRIALKNMVVNAKELG